MKLLIVIGAAFLVLAVGAYLQIPPLDGLPEYSWTLFFSVMGACFLIPSLFIQSLIGSKKKKIETLLATGTQGEATVLSLDDTGMRINEDPRVRIRLEVRIDGHAPYEVEKAMVIPMIRLPQVQPGSTVLVMADPREPDNPDKVGLLLR